jgi:hypothetical protein
MWTTSGVLGVRIMSFIKKTPVPMGLYLMASVVGFAGLVVIWKVTEEYEPELPTYFKGNFKIFSSNERG